MKKLNWFEDTGGAWSDEGVDSATVWKTAYNGKEGSFYIEVYPLSLIHKDLKGWEYRIMETEPNGGAIKEDGFEYDSASESNNENDHAPTAKVAMKWAENTLEDILEEREAKKVKA